MSDGHLAVMSEKECEWDKGKREWKRGSCREKERTHGGGNDCMTKHKVEEPPPSYRVRPLTEPLHSPEQSQSHRSNPFEHVSLLLKPLSTNYTPVTTSAGPLTEGQRSERRLLTQINILNYLWAFKRWREKGEKRVQRTKTQQTDSGERWIETIQ